MAPFELTLMTQPVPPKSNLFVRAIKRLRNISELSRVANNSGHAGVNRSLTQGLAAKGINFNFNPTQLDSVARTVMVLSNTDALKQAITLKLQKKIDYLLAGPNLVVRSTDATGILGEPEIDLVIVPADWVGAAYIDEMPSLKTKTRTWPAGVDDKAWMPTAGAQKQNVALVYWKTEPETFCLEAERLLREKGWKVKRFRYGEYSAAAYKAALAESKFAVFISRSESQGLALAEAWAMDVPTFVWNPEELVIDQYRYKAVSACPYLTPETGLTWKTFNELAKLLDSAPNNLGHFRPRFWITKNLTDEISASRILEIVRELKTQKKINGAPHASA